MNSKRDHLDLGTAKLEFNGSILPLNEHLTYKRTIDPRASTSVQH
jgi:hypothetical protein